MTRLFISALAMGALALSLTACGRQGDLDRPGPMWGAQAKAEYAAKKRHEADQKTNQAESNQIETLPGEGDPTTNPAPERSDPIQGQRPDPYGQAQPGALPDPYASPQ